MDRLKSYSPSEKGRELIAVLFPLSQADREKNILAFWKRYPTEINAVLDGFHYLIQELVEAREAGSNDDNLNLPDDLTFAIFKRIYQEENFFSYDSGPDFLAAINQFQPPIFSDPSKISLIFSNALEAAQKGRSASSAAKPDISESLRIKLRDVCDTTAKAYEDVLRVVPSVRRAKKVINELKGTKDQLELIDLNLAKETYSESISTFNKHTKAISEGFAFVVEVYQKHKDQLLVIQIYGKFLAKVLASRESIQQTERYVLRMAQGDFTHEEPDISPSDEQLRQGITSPTLRDKFKNKLLKHIHRLECRYHKRKLMIQLKEGVPRIQIIKGLIRIAESDQEDIKTSILLARLLAEHSKTLREAGKRKYTREEALRYCKIASSKIDAYLKMQRYKNDRERDIQRAGLMKTITAIRLPLIQK